MMERKTPADEALADKSGAKTPPPPSGESRAAVITLVVAVVIAGAAAFLYRVPQSTQPRQALDKLVTPTPDVAKAQPRSAEPPRVAAAPEPPRPAPRSEPPPAAAPRSDPPAAPLPAQAAAPPQPATQPEPPAPARSAGPAPDNVTAPAPPSPPAGAGAPERTAVPDEEVETKVWTAVADSDDPVRLQSYLNLYPNGRYADLARQRLAALRTEPREPPPPPAAADPPKEEPPPRAAAVDPPPQPPPPAAGAGQPAPAQNVELVRALQRELRRIGCFGGEADGVWGDKSRAAVKSFLKHVRLGVDGEEPSIAVLDAATAARGRICPPVCDDDERLVNGRCVAKVRPARAERREEPRQQHRPARERYGEPPSNPRSGQKLCFGAGRNELVRCN